MPMPLPTLDQINDAAEIVYGSIPPTPQYCWPLLSERAGLPVWVKHENHTPTGAFKVRGGLVYMSEFRAKHNGARGVATATRGNHGQSVAFAASAQGLESVIVVPENNSVEKNAAMRSFGGELVVHGRDFQESREYAEEIADERGLVMLGPYEEPLIRGVSTYAAELMQAVPDLDVLYVPIGMGSGISGCIAARNALGRKTKVVGVVAEQAPAYALSFEAGHVVTTNSSDTIADGMACRTPQEDALEVILEGANHIVRLSEDEICEAMRAYYTDTHNLAEGAGAAPLAALLKEKDRLKGKTAAVILCGQNIDARLFSRVLAGETPEF